MPSDDFIDAGDTSQNWRSELPKKKGMVREVRVVVYAFYAAVIIGVLIGIIIWLIPHPVETHFVFAPVIGYYKNNQFQEAPFGEQDSNELLTIVPQKENFNLSKYSIRSDIRSFLDNEFIKQKDKTESKPLVVFLSALGRQANNQPYLLPADFQPDDPESWIPLKDIIEKIQTHPAKRKLLLLDLACPAATVTPGPYKNDISDSIDALLEQMIKDKDKPLKMAVFTSCSRGETSHRKWPLRQSVFGYYLVEGLRGKAVSSGTKDKDKDAVSVLDLTEYVKDRVDFWARRCLDASQHPQLYKPADFHDFELVKIRQNLDKNDTKQVTSTAPETPESRKAAEESKEAKLNDLLNTQFFPEALRQTWKSRDVIWDFADWPLIYPAIRQWELRLLGIERRFQANGELDQSSVRSPEQYHRPRLGFVFGLHHATPKINPEDKEWNEQLPLVRKYDFKKKEDASSLSWFDQASKPDKGRIIAQSLWANLEKPGAISLDAMEDFAKVLKLIGQADGFVENYLVLALVSRARAGGYEVLDFPGKSSNAENFTRMVRLIRLLEEEAGRLIEHPENLKYCQEKLDSAQKALHQAMDDQFHKKGADYRYDSPDHITKLLEESRRLLTEAKGQRENLEKYRQNYWESVRRLHATSEQAPYALELYQPWLNAAEATIKLGAYLSNPGKVEYTLPSEWNALQQPLIGSFTPDRQKKWEADHATLSGDAKRTADLLEELRSTRLPADWREKCWRVVLREIEENNRKLHLESKPQTSPLSDQEKDYSIRREKAGKLLRQIAGVSESEKLSDLAKRRKELIEKQAWFDAARLECLMPLKDLPETRKLALVLENQQATIDLARWLTTRLDAQQELLVKFKIDAAFKTVYTPATQACAKLENECKTLLK